MHSAYERLMLKMTYDDKGETALWRAVIGQALIDAKYGNGKKRNSKYTKESAQSWLLCNQADFTTVCERAGLEPVAIRERARRFLKEQRK